MKVFTFSLLLLACFLLKSCKVLLYEKMDLQLANPNSVLRSKLNKKTKNPYVVVIHNDDTYDTIPQTIQVQSAIIEDKTLIGTVSQIEQYEVKDAYYQQLKNESEDGYASTKIKRPDRDIALNQIHVWVNDSIYKSISTDVRIKTNQILAIEKLRTFKTRMVFIILGITIATLIGLAIYDLNNGGLAITPS